MIDNTGELEFEVFGVKVRFSPKEEEVDCSPDEVVEYLKREADAIRSKNPNLINEQLAILVALKLAQDNMALRKEYRTSIDQLHETAKDALLSLEFI